MDVDWGIVIAGIALIVAILGTVFSTYLTRESNKITKQSYEDSKKVSETDIALRLSDTAYRSQESKTILSCIRQKKHILKENGGRVEQEDLENFLNELDAVLMQFKRGIITKDIFDYTFGWILDRVIENPEIQDHIKNAQKKYGYVAWGEITKYSNVKK